MRIFGWRAQTIDEWKAGEWFAWYPVFALTADKKKWRLVWLERVRYSRFQGVGGHGDWQYRLLEVKDLTSGHNL